MFRAIGERLREIREDIADFEETPSDYSIMCIDPDDAIPLEATIQWRAIVPIKDVVPGAALTNIPRYLLNQHNAECVANGHNIIIVQSYPNIQFGA